MPGPGDRGGKKEKPKDAKGTLLRILNYLEKYKWIVALLFACAIVSNIGNLLGPRFAGKAIGVAEEGYKKGVGQVDMDQVLHYTILMLLAYVCSNILGFTVSVCMTRVGKRVAQNLRQDVFEKLMKLPVSYFDRNQAGDIISRVSYDIDVVSTCLSTDVIQILTSTITVVGSFIIMCTISVPLVLCMIFTIPLSIWYTKRMGKITRPLYSKRSAAYGVMNGYAEEMFTGQKTILAYACEDKMSEKFSDINRNAAEAYRNADGMGMKMGPTIGMISNLGLAAIGMGGAVLYMKAIVGLEQISSFILYSRKFSGPINEISNIINEIFSALAAGERVFHLLDQPEEAADLYGATTLEDCQGEVGAKHVAFGYVPEKTILKDLNFEAKPGQTIAIVGPTGAGKTTIIKLLLRLYDPTEGYITLNGTDIRRFRRKDYYRLFAPVFQNVEIFAFLLGENISLKQIERTDRDKVLKCAEEADLFDKISSLEKGIDTPLTNVVEDDGVDLSGGEKQKLALARALYKGAKIVVLDEPTSALDALAEQALYERFDEMVGTKSAVYISHRLASTRFCDNVAMFADGKMIEYGTHDELMERGGEYADMLNTQAQYYREESGVSENE